MSKPKYIWQPSLDVTTSDIQEFGISARMAFTWRNLFKRAETFELSAKGNIGSSKDLANPNDVFFNISEYGIEGKLSFPRIVDIYNPKVVQATMGSISRVNVVYGSLEAFLTKTKLPIFGTFMDGSNIYQEALPKEGFIVMGNEANGISPSVEKLVSERIAIPRFGNIQLTESLNVATATAIILSEFKRN
uniref:TrmH family RNA methyltransferase n=1 Tax=Flavobacterium sp. TaxID=239 RepID=UPI004047997F